MVAAFAIAFVTPVMALNLFADDGQQNTVIASCLKDVMHQVLHPGETLSPAG